MTNIQLTLYQIVKYYFPPMIRNKAKVLTLTSPIVIRLSLAIEMNLEKNI